MIACTATICASAGGTELPPDIAADRWLVRAEWQAERGELDDALASLDVSQALRREHELPTPPDVWFRRAQVERKALGRQRAEASLIRYVLAAGRDGEHYWTALKYLDALARHNEAAEAAKTARGEGGPFADPLASGGTGPEMVIIPAGRFLMGCVSGRDCHEDELPVHEITIPQPFALSVYEVTFAQWDACVADGGCSQYLPSANGWGRADRPVINVTWAHAQEYVTWLSSQTRAEYRLPSEAEWEYAARAGTQTQYSWGDEIGQNNANCDGCGSLWDNARTAPVGSFAPNAFGLYDMHGNVSEWVEDCWAPDYAVPRTNGGLWQGQVNGCEGRAFRDGSFYDYPEDLRSAFRNWSDAGYWNFYIGFRVARTLDPAH